MSTFWHVVLPNIADADLCRRHPAVPVDLERAAAAAALPAHQRSAAGPLRPHRRHLRAQLGPPIGRRDHHHHRPAHRLPRLSASVRRRRAGSYRHQGVVRTCTPRPPSRCATGRFISTSIPPSTSPASAPPSIPMTFVGDPQGAPTSTRSRIFAKCHHGWSYYPTKVGAPHPNLARPDLLGDMVTALKAADIECPIYISVQWDERNARLHPEWRVLSASNAFQHALPKRSVERQAAEPCLAHAVPQSRGLSRRAAGTGARGRSARYDTPGHVLRHHPDARLRLPRLPRHDGRAWASIRRSRPTGSRMTNGSTSASAAR